MATNRRTVAETLASSPFAALLDHARRLDRLSAVVTHFGLETVGDDPSLPPPLCAFQSRTLVVTLSTPSQAAKWRQQASALHHLLQDCDPEVTGIRIRLQPGRSAVPPPLGRTTDFDGTAPPSRYPLPDLPAALRFADDLSRSLHDSPLRRSVQRLQANLRRKLAAR